MQDAVTLPVGRDAVQSITGEAGTVVSVNAIVPVGKIEPVSKPGFTTEAENVPCWLTTKDSPAVGELMLTVGTVVPTNRDADVAEEIAKFGSPL